MHLTLPGGMFRLWRNGSYRHLSAARRAYTLEAWAWATQLSFAGSGWLWSLAVSRSPSAS
jgi:hypothetical protein